jgi:hypothetical protein
VGFSTVTGRSLHRGRSFFLRVFFSFTPWACNLLPGVHPRGSCFNVWRGCRSGCSLQHSCKFVLSCSVPCNGTSSPLVVTAVKKKSLPVQRSIVITIFISYAKVRCINVLIGLEAGLQSFHGLLPLLPAFITSQFSFRFYAPPIS